MTASRFQHTVSSGVVFVGCCACHLWLSFTQQPYEAFPVSPVNFNFLYQPSKLEFYPGRKRHRQGRFRSSAKMNSGTSFPASL